MGLRAKFNLTVIIAFAIGFVGMAFLLQRLFIENARQEVLEDARIMMRAADAIGTYTDQHVVPLAASQNDTGMKFISAAVPFFAEETTFKDVQKRFPEFSYRLPTLNPTNLADRPTDWEADYINAFLNNSETKELSGERQTPTGPVLNLARPIEVDSPDCLMCHSTPARAPASMVATYGSTDGFGWKLHQIVGAQVVSVPMSLPLQYARQTLIACMAILLAVFMVIMVILNVLLHYVVIKPVTKVTRIANAVSLGDLDVEEYERKGGDEIAILSVAFNRMRRSLDSAMRMLER
jgi:methyl-accepting chemotaxis protein